MMICSLLTGRGNNTLKDKNILEILGHPVLYYPAKALKNTHLVERHFCSSNDEKILHEAEKLGFVRVKRPESISGPESQHIECILHGLDEMKQKGSLPEILIVALANNITIKSIWIDDCIRIMQNNMNISAVVPVYLDNDHHPLRAKVKNSNGFLNMYDKNYNGTISTNRQDLTPCYFLAHNFWVLNVKTLYDENGQLPWSFMGNNIWPYEIAESIDIHKEIDLFIAEKWIKENYLE